MIRQLRGRGVARGKDYLVVDIGGGPGGLAFKVFVPEPTALQFNIGDSIILNTYLQVREDALTLFGFTNEEELATFEQLLSVSGIGPKLALSVLSALSPEALQIALANEEPAVLARVPGIGKRTAEKIVVELKGKVKTSAGSIAALATVTNTDSEVIEALVALGYSVIESQRAIQALPKEVTGVEERLRLALSKFMT